MYDNHRKEQQNPVKTPVQQSFGRTAKKNAGFAWLSARLPGLHPPVPVAAARPQVVCGIRSPVGSICCRVPVLAPVTLQLQLLIRFSCPYWICTSTAAACPQVVCGIRSPVGSICCRVRLHAGSGRPLPLSARLPRLHPPVPVAAACPQVVCGIRSPS